MMINICAYVLMVIGLNGASIDKERSCYSNHIECYETLKGARTIRGQGRGANVVMFCRPSSKAEKEEYKKEGRLTVKSRYSF